MKELHRQFSDEEFLLRFEALALPEGSISHEAHFRVAWLYLSTWSFDDALYKTIKGFQLFDQKLAGGTKYHATITHAYMYIIFDLYDTGIYASWQDFLAQNTFLLKPVNEVLLKYYTKELLYSDDAKKRFVLPDRMSLPRVKKATP
jgi:hypothetical protein